MIPPLRNRKHNTSSIKRSSIGCRRCFTTGGGCSGGNSSANCAFSSIFVASCINVSSPDLYPSEGFWKKEKAGGHPQTPAQGLPPLRTLLSFPRKDADPFYRISILLVILRKKGNLGIPQTPVQGLPPLSTLLSFPRKDGFQCWIKCPIRSMRLFVNLCNFGARLSVLHYTHSRLTCLLHRIIHSTRDPCQQC